MGSVGKGGGKTVQDEETLSKLLSGDKKALAQRAQKGGNLPKGAHPDEAEIAKKYGLSVEQVRELHQLFKKGEKAAKRSEKGEEHGGEAKEPWYAKEGRGFWRYFLGGSGKNADSLYGNFVQSGGGEKGAGSPFDEALKDFLNKAKGKGKAGSKPSGQSAPSSAGTPSSGASSGGASSSGSK